MCILLLDRNFYAKSRKMALTLTFLCAIIYNCISIGKIPISGHFVPSFEKKEQKKYNLNGPKGTAVLRCNSKGVIAFYGARGSDGEALQAHELLAHR